jgi:hypothetical protein
MVMLKIRVPVAMGAKLYVPVDPNVAKHNGKSDPPTYVGVNVFVPVAGRIPAAKVTLGAQELKLKG